MKKIIYFSVFVAIQLFTGSLFAQNDSYTSERRNCLVKALDVIFEYERCAKLDDAASAQTFKSLFKSQDINIFNDLLGVSAKDVLSVDEYVKLKRQNTKITNLYVKNIKKLSVEKNGDVWKVVCGFDKEMDYSTKCGVFFSSKEFYGSDYHMRIEMQFDPENNTCLIEKLSGKIDSDKSMPEDYFVVLKDEDLSRVDVLYNSEPLSYNAYDQALMTGLFNPSKLTCNDSDVKIVARSDESCQQIVNLRTIVRRMRLKFHCGFSLGNALSLDNQASGMTSKSSQSNFGLDFGYIFPNKSSFKTGLFLGVGMENTSLKLGYENTLYTFKTNEDVDGDSYSRRYHDLSLSQESKFTALSVPLYFDFSINFNGNLSMYADLGAKMRYCISDKLSITQGSAKIDGLYSQYDDLIISEDWGYNGFGERAFSNSDLIADRNSDINKFTVDALAGVGFRYNVPVVPLSVELGISYQLGLMNLVNKNYQKVDLSNTALSNPVVYNTISGMNSYEHVRNLTESTDGIKTNALKLNIGLIYKF